MSRFRWIAFWLAFCLHAQTPASPTPGGGRGRGVAAEPAAPVATAEVDETPVVTHHSVQVEGKTLNYTATVAQMPIKNSSGETEAHIFYVAYTLDDVKDPGKRPLAFCFNGRAGRGIACGCTWAPWDLAVLKLMSNGNMPPPPYQLRDNPNTWLDQTDLVFIDPVGTGYSRAKTIEIARRMNGVQGDLQSVGEFIRMYIVRNSRELSPLFLAGESFWHVPRGGAGGLPDRSRDCVQRRGADFGDAQPGDDLVALGRPAYELEGQPTRRMPGTQKKVARRPADARTSRHFLAEVEKFRDERVRHGAQ